METKRKIALFESAEYNYVSIQDDSWDDMKGYSRLTEYLEVDFSPRAEQDVILDKVGALKEEKVKILAESQSKVDIIEDKIGKLLCLGHDSHKYEDVISGDDIIF